MTARLDHVSKDFRLGDETITAVDDISMHVRAGEFACLYGASGSGKTTLLHILAGIEQADSGTVEVAGVSLSGESERTRADVRLRHVGVIFQSNNLLPEFSARENVALPLMVRGRGRDESMTEASAALEAVGLTGLDDRFPAHMSGGQRQRVGIARALAGKQQVLIADEPTGALDSDTSKHLFTLMRDLSDAHGVTIILATHDPLARDFADVVHHIVDGRLSP
ncbi:ABC transporter ATP-binding protein [Nocardioides sp. 503]|uniref:ABC transporter ATP-binding protein n=1 Tax=Nocardioides sp. 503 TaxID=2508326 RepID=UPI0014320985|nr:ABC transporter ATP-binding protein [Nocardioides sp. 503]